MLTSKSVLANVKHVSVSSSEDFSRPVGYGNCMSNLGASKYFDHRGAIENKAKTRERSRYEDICYFTITCPIEQTF